MLIEICWWNQGETVFDNSWHEGQKAKDKASSQGKERPFYLPYRRSPRLPYEHPGHSQENETQSQANVGQEESDAQQGKGSSMAVAILPSLFLGETLESRETLRGWYDALPIPAKEQAEANIQ